MHPAYVIVLLETALGKPIFTQERTFYCKQSPYGVYSTP